MTDSESQRFSPWSLRASLSWVLLLYVLSYFSVRHIYDDSGPSLIPGHPNYESVFDHDKPLDCLAYYTYWPLGYLDEQVTGKRYALRKSLLDRVLD